MPRDTQEIGRCPKCDGEPLSCSYNHFANDGLTIDAWEHKCADCGFRDTRAFRSDDESDDEQVVDPRICPFCGRKPSDGA